MNYYKQGDAANADKIKAAFEKLGIYVDGYDFGRKDVLFFTFKAKGNTYLMSSVLDTGLADIIKTHPDYKELELPVEPKFKVEDWITNGLCTIQISSIGYEKINGTLCMMYYHNNNTIGGDVESIDKEYHLWSIADAKDGDVLISKSGNPLIFLEDRVYAGYHNIIAYCGINTMGNFTKSSRKERWTYDTSLKPAIKEQRELLFAKIREAGYHWDAEKKELKKISKHYDIANFKPFDKVLVRFCDGANWCCALFSHYCTRGNCHFVCSGGSVTQCIPFNEKTKHLLGTTEMCPQEYINW